MQQILNLILDIGIIFLALTLIATFFRVEQSSFIRQNLLKNYTTPSIQLEVLFYWLKWKLLKEGCLNGCSIIIVLMINFLSSMYFDHTYIYQPTNRVGSVNRSDAITSVTINDSK